MPGPEDFSRLDGGPADGDLVIVDLAIVLDEDYLIGSDHLPNSQQIRVAVRRVGKAEPLFVEESLYRLLSDLPRPLDQQTLVFPGLSPDAVTMAFHRLVSDLKLPNLRFHDLRHDVASTLTTAGVPQRTVMEILGHKDPKMTLRYQHLSPEHLKRAMSLLEENAASQGKFAAVQ